MRKDFFSIAPKSIKTKLVLSFSLMSVIPLLILLNYMFPSVFRIFLSKENFIIVFFVDVLISLSGLFLLREIFGDMNKKVELLEIKDASTGTYNKKYIQARLDEEIKRAIIMQRPCSLILAALNHKVSGPDSFGLKISEPVIKKIAASLKCCLSDIDKIGRFDEYIFAIILPEKNKRQAQKVAEVLKKKADWPSIKVAVAENPLDGICAQELVDAAMKTLAGNG